jgi:hypothetical protein
MEVLGINWSYLFVMFTNILLIGGWLILSALALFQLRHRELSETARAVWALILLIPIVGALAFWIIKPGKRISKSREIV